MKRTKEEAFIALQPFLSRDPSGAPETRFPVSRRMHDGQWLTTYHEHLCARVELSHPLVDGLVPDAALPPMVNYTLQQGKSRGYGKLPWDRAHEHSRLVHVWNEAVDTVQALGRTRAEPGMLGFACDLVWGGRCKGVTLQLQRMGTHRPYWPGEEDVRVDLRYIATVGKIRKAAIVRDHPGCEASLLLNLVTLDGVEVVTISWTWPARRGLAPEWVPWHRGQRRGYLCTVDGECVSVGYNAAQKTSHVRVYRADTMSVHGMPLETVEPPREALQHWLRQNEGCEAHGAVSQALANFPEIWP